MKRNMTTRILSVLLAMCIFLFVGCSSASNETPSATATQAPAETSAPEQTADAGGEFVLGFVAPLSGSSADAGNEYLNGVKLAVEQLNAAGGLNGQQIRLVSYDDEASPATCLSAITKLCTTDKANAVVGSIMSSCMISVLDTISQYKMPTFTGGTSPSLTNKDCKYIFRATINQDYVMEDVMKAFQQMGVKTAGLITGQDEAQVKSGDQFVASCEKINIQIVGREYVTDGDTDYTAQCARLVEANPDVVFFAAAAQPQPLIVKQLRDNGYKGMLWHKESYQQMGIDVAGKAADYVGFSWPCVSYQDPADATGLMKEFLTAYKEMYGKLPATDCAYRGYDSMTVLKEACKIAGTNESAAIADAIHTISDLELLGGKADYTNGTGEGYQAGQLYYVLDGKYQLFQPWLESGGYAEFMKSIGK